MSVSRISGLSFGGGIQKVLASVFVLTLTLVFLSVPAYAKFPEKPIRVILHTSPGGGVDIMARLVVKHASRLTGADFVVENFAGAGGQIGYTRLAMAKPDGYTIGTISTMSIVTHELTRKNVPYKFKESFVPLARITLDPSVLVVRSESPFKTLDDVIAEAKKSPGELTWGGSFMYGTHHIQYILFNKETGASLKYIPYDGGAKTKAALLGGHIDLATDGISNYVSLINDGTVRILASAGDKQWKNIPEVPLYKDMGYNISLGSNRGFALPAGAPAEAVQWFDDLFARVAQDEEFLKEAEKISIAPTIAHLGSKEFSNYLSQLQETMTEVLPKK